jgi:hypothetical protein
LDALPAAAKDPVKQKAGIQSRKALGERSAADSAAKTLTAVSGKPQILVTSDGHERIEDDSSYPVNQDNSNISEQKGDLPRGKVRPADDMAATISGLGAEGASSNRNEPMTLEISIPDGKIDSYRLSGPAEDELSKVTRIYILVDRLTEQVIGVELGDLADGGVNS